MNNQWTRNYTVTFPTMGILTNGPSVTVRAGSREEAVAYARAELARVSAVPDSKLTVS